MDEAKPWQHVHRCESGGGSIESHRRTQIGGLIARANLTRTGVFEYRDAGGNVRRELRPPEEVFARPTLDSYPHAPLTVDHPGRVTPENFRRHTVGHVADAQRAGDFVAGDVHVQDADTIGEVEQGHLVEVSSGYSCDVDPTPGVFRGQKYDAVQRNIRINHVAVGPPGWGRMGPDVRLHLDSASADGEFLATGVSYVRLDMDELEQAKQDLAKATRELDQSRQDAATARSAQERADAQHRTDAAELTKLRAENEMLKLQDKRRQDSHEDQAAAARQDQKMLALAHELMELVADARAVFATPQDSTGKAWKADDKTPDMIRREVIAHLEPKFGLLRQDGKSLDGEALAGPYQMAVSHWRDTEAARADAQAAAAAERKKEKGGDDEDDDDPEKMFGADAAKARRDMVERKRDGWKRKDANGKAC